MQIRMVQIDAESVMRALVVMQSSFSGGEEAIKFEIPIRFRGGFELMFVRMELPPSVDSVEEETLDSKRAQETLGMEIDEAFELREAKAEWSEIGGVCMTGEGASNLDDTIGLCEVGSTPTGEFRSGETDSEVEIGNELDDLEMVSAEV